MADYADLDSVKDILELTGNDHDARLATLNTVASRQLEEAAGLASGSEWGAASPEADVSRTFLPGDWSDVLLLSPPVRSVTSVTVDGQTLTEDDDYRLINRMGAFYGALYRMPGSLYGWQIVNGPSCSYAAWSGTVVVTGQWADQGTDGDVDPVIVEAANVLVAGYFRKDGASDGEVSGPDGLTFRPSNPWRDERVKRFLDRYQRVPA